VTEKTSFSGLIPSADDIPHTVKACANCAHARIAFHSQVARRMATCKAVSAQAVTLPAMVNGVQVGMGVRWQWPVLALSEECDLFEPADLRSFLPESGQNGA
jgi:hypothetical protein